MFCPKCGNQMQDHERFCGKCGAMVQNAQPQQAPQQQYQQQYQQPQYQQAPGYPYQQAPMQRPAADPKIADTLKVQFLVLAGLSVLIALLWYIGGFTASVMGMKDSASFHVVCKEGDVAALSILNLLVALIAAVMYAYPVLTNTIAKRRRLIMPQILGVLNFIFLLIMILALKEANSYTMGLGSIKINFMGWIDILVHLIILGMPTIVARKTKVYGR